MIWVYTASFLLLSLFSFTQIDLNLTLYNSNLLLPILNFLKNIGYRQRTLSAVIFIILATSLYFNYLKLVYKQKTSKKHLKIVLLVTFLAGIPA